MILKGQPIAQKIYQELRKENCHPSLAVILIGEDPVSMSYVEAKEEAAQNLGAIFKLYHLPGISTQKEVEKLIIDLNQNKYIQGIVVQLPLPSDFDVDEVLKKISPEKDIDGFSGKFPAPTAQAILEILEFYGVDIKNKKIVVVGRGRLVGKPLEAMLQKKGLSPIVCDSKTENLSQITSKADILISATGVAGLIRKDMVSEKTILIDAGSSEMDGHILGDVDKQVYQKVKSYSPVPGGVGPVTVAILMRNLYQAAKK